MIQLWMVCALAVLLQTQTSLTVTEKSTATDNSTSPISAVNLTTSEPPTSLSTVNVSRTTVTNTGGFSLPSSNFLFVSLTIIASIFHHSC